MWNVASVMLWQDLSVECGICYVVVAGLECGMWHLLCYGRT